MIAVRLTKIASICLVFLVLAALLTPAQPVRGTTVIRVTPDGAAVAGCGTSWDNPCTLQAALSGAVDGAEIWAAGGLYLPGEAGDVEATFLIPSGVALYGGFAGTETIRDERDWVANPTILSGDIDKNDSNLDGNSIAESWNDIQGTNAYHVVTFDTSTEITPETMIDGVIVTAGDADDFASGRAGGGVYCPRELDRMSCSPTLTNVRISGNRAAQGGGMFMQGIGDVSHMPVLSHVIFSGNYAHDRGGGLYNQNASHPMLTDVIFRDNHADRGGGFYSGSNRSAAGISLERVELLDNYAERDGGGAYLFAYRIGHLATFTDVTFRGNEANYGGGLFDSTRPGLGIPIRLTRVTFDRNRAVFSGGGMASVNQLDALTTSAAAAPNYSSPVLVDVTFLRNRALDMGGGLHIADGSVLGLQLSNATFSGNRAASGGGLACTDGCRTTLQNALFSGNHAEYEGGGLHLSGVWGATADVKLVNATFSGNHAVERGGAVARTAYMDGSAYLEIANSILWGNTAASDPTIATIGDPYQQEVVASYSLIEGWDTDTDNHVWGDRDPEFIAPAAVAAPNTSGNYRLRLASPAIDAGDNERVLPGIEVDLDGNPRFVEVPSVPNTGNGTPPIVDMGAYEHSGAPDPTAELLLSQSVGPAFGLPGQPVTMTLTFTNSGELPVTGVVLTLTLPAGLTSGEESSKVWTIGRLDPGTSGTRTVVTHIVDTLSQDTDLWTSSALSSETGEISEASLAVEVRVPRVYFQTDTYAALKADGAAAITVRLDPPNPYATAQVSYRSADGSATAGVDYEPVTGTLTIAPEQTSASFNVPILAGAELEDGKSVQLELHTPVGAALGEPETAILMLTDPEDTNGQVLDVFLPLLFHTHGSTGSQR
jgi:uncharacterized repeat protein (TIGR01451 family)